MSVLNKDDFYYLNNTTNWGNPPIKEKRINTFFWSIRDFSDCDCYYFEFKHGDAFDVFPIETLISNEALQSIKNGKVKLIICNSHEAFHSVVDGIYRSLVLREQIPPEQIVLISESADILSEVKRVSNMLNVGEIKVEWIRLFEADVQIQKLRLTESNQVLNTLVDKVYDKKFLNFNRRWRAHRPMLVALMFAKNLIDKGYVSLGASDDRKTWENAWRGMKHYHRNDKIITDLLDHHETEIKALPNLYIDTNDLVENKAFLESNTDYLYENTYFSVVTETNFYTNDSLEIGRFLSEKTFKPIAQQHPFIIVSVPKMLETLKSLGYKTFSPWINESYDDELNDSNRLLMIVEEIRRLTQLTPAQLTEFLDNVRSICQHNLSVLQSKTTYVTKLN